MIPQNRHAKSAATLGRNEDGVETIILASDRSVVGIDQSRQMLLKAQAKHPNVQVEKLGLQEMPFIGAFDGICRKDPNLNLTQLG